MTDAQPVSQDMIQAYVDDRLTGGEVRAVETYLAQAPAEAARAAAYVEQRRQLREALQAKFDEPVPSRLKIAEIRRMQRQRQTRRLMGLAAMLAVAITAGIAGWLAAPHFEGNGSDPLVAEALSVRDGKLHPDRMIEAEALATPEAGDPVVAATLDVPAKIPDLAEAGYRLSGIAVLREPGGGAALQVSYRDQKGGVFTLFLRRSAGSDRFDLSRRGSMQICVWQNDVLSVVMLGEMPAKEMLKVATMTYSALDF